MDPDKELGARHSQDRAASFLVEIPGSEREQARVQFQIDFAGIEGAEPALPDRARNALIAEIRDQIRSGKLNLVDTDELGTQMKGLVISAMNRVISEYPWLTQKLVNKPAFTLNLAITLPPEEDGSATAVVLSVGDGTALKLTLGDNNTYSTQELTYEQTLPAITFRKALGDEYKACQLVNAIKFGNKSFETQQQILELLSPYDLEQILSKTSTQPSLEELPPERAAQIIIDFYKHNKNIITNAVRIGPSGGEFKDLGDVNVQVVSLNPGDILLLTSDGFGENITPDQWGSIAEQAQGNAKKMSLLARRAFYYSLYTKGILSDPLRYGLSEQLAETIKSMVAKTGGTMGLKEGLRHSIEQNPFLPKIDDTNLSIGVAPVATQLRAMAEDWRRTVHTKEQ